MESFTVLLLRTVVCQQNIRIFWKNNFANYTLLSIFFLIYISISLMIVANFFYYLYFMSTIVLSLKFCELCSFIIICFTHSIGHMVFANNFILSIIYFIFSLLLLIYANNYLLCICYFIYFLVLIIFFQ